MTCRHTRFAYLDMKAEGGLGWPGLVTGQFPGETPPHGALLPSTHSLPQLQGPQGWGSAKSYSARGEWCRGGQT